jgi:hypothetical protein
MEQSDLLGFVVRAIEGMGVAYFVTGSTATIFYGEPRLTNDIDVVVDISETQVAEFCRRFPEDEFYVSEAAAREAARSNGQFNVIHPASGLKVDVIVPAPTRFNQSRFARVRRIQAAGDLQACFTSPEDAIIKKMDSYREGGSEKHLRDIAGVLKTSGVQIDRAYIEEWAREMDLMEIWTTIQNAAGGSDR